MEAGRLESESYQGRKERFERRREEDTDSIRKDRGGTGNNGVEGARRGKERRTKYIKGEGGKHVPSHRTIFLLFFGHNSSWSNGGVCGFGNIGLPYVLYISPPARGRPSQLALHHCIRWFSIIRGMVYIPERGIGFLDTSILNTSII